MTRVHAYRRNSHDIASVMMGEAWAGQPTERWQDKSREVRGGRSGEEGMRIKSLARCAHSRDSLSVRTSLWKCTHDHTSCPNTK
jgi:hypothetical protein